MHSMDSTIADSGEQELGSRRPRGRRPEQVTTIRKAAVIGALVVLLVGGASSLATARLTDRQADLDQHRAENSQLASDVSRQAAQIAQLASQVSQQEAQLAASANQAGAGTQAVDRLNAEIAAMKGQVDALEAEKASLEQQLSDIQNPAPGPTPTALLTARWVHRLYPGEVATLVCVEIENTSDADVTISYSWTQFSAIDGADFVYPPRLYTQGSMRPTFPLLDGQLRPGEKRRGQLLMDVPAEARLTGLVWDIGFDRTPVTVDVPAETYLVVNNVTPGSHANDC